MKNRYRIRADRYSWYEAQVKFWWFPFAWFQFGGSNTHATVERAEQYIVRLNFSKEVRL